MDTSCTRSRAPGERKKADVEVILGLGKRQGGKTGERGPNQIRKEPCSEDVWVNKAELDHASAFSPQSLQMTAVTRTRNSKGEDSS